MAIYCPTVIHNAFTVAVWRLILLAASLTYFLLLTASPGLKYLLVLLPTEIYSDGMIIIFWTCESRGLAPRTNAKSHP